MLMQMQYSVRNASKSLVNFSQLVNQLQLVRSTTFTHVYSSVYTHVYYCKKKKLIGTQTTQTPTRRRDPTGSLSPKNFPSLFVAFSSCLPRNYVDITTLFAPRIKN